MALLLIVTPLALLGIAPSCAKLEIGQLGEIETFLIRGWFFCHIKRVTLLGVFKQF